MVASGNHMTKVTKRSTFIKLV